MPRYYLHIHNGHDLELDPEGEDFPDLGAAQLEAKRVIGEVWLDWSEARIGMAIEIVDETGQTVLRVPFADAIGRTQ
ncbi:DUF6894 family protein [Microvirga mediterraneensis]|uniref:DUF6894 domain-containing protein n=1 Tax=Microvirga mediterraneensis TaxID=2754695 RepID=A0A838BW03_9HYPH|nr:hypothetical protein [Microvirga mediterraneensis]MBA1159045.1 hypothetical protein [Microvirga mediterraneensis]